MEGYEEARRSSRYAPEYTSAIRFDGSRAGSFVVRDRAGMPAPLDSTRALANDDLQASSRREVEERQEENEAGIGAGRNAYMAPDTPSVYTDPMEYASNVGTQRRGHANVMATRPHFLAYDPYGTYPPQPPGLTRSDTMGTLAPGDSVSAYDVHAPSRRLPSIDRSREDGVYMMDEQANWSYDDGHTYVNHDGAYAMDPAHFDASGASLPLKEHAGAMGYAEDEDEEKQARERHWNGAWKEAWHPPPSLFANNMQGPAVPRKSVETHEEDRRGLLGALTGRGSRSGWGGSVEEQIERRRRGMGRQRWPILSWMLGIAYVVVFVVELVKAKSATGQAIQTKPSVNPMIGPPYEFLIAFGARFVPCMRNVPDLALDTPMICLQDSALSSVPQGQTCPLYEICGLPNADTYGQAWRFVTPMFVHAGFVHILFNLLAQLTLCAQMEKILSTPFYAIVFTAGGIGGNLLGGNFGLVGLPSVGASGAIYACISLELVDLLYNWKYEYRPKTRLIASIVFTIIGLAIGLLPGLDNFAHIGGFAVGILGGLLFGPSIHETKAHRRTTWILRVLAVALLIGFFVGLGTNFYNSADPRQTCTWCRYLSCLPTFSQCKGNGLTMTTTTTH